MDYTQMLERRAACASESAASHASANAALKTLRFYATSQKAQRVPWASGQSGSTIDVTGFETILVVPWEYHDEKGPVGQWKGETFDWSWKDYVAMLDRSMYETMFGREGIQRFVCRACPFPSPYPVTPSGPHWEFTVTLTDGEHVGLHPPGRRGKLCWTWASDAFREAALAAVAKKGVSEKVRACYPDTSRPRTRPQGPTHTEFRPVGHTPRGAFR